MPRNAAGVYSLPETPVVAGTTIEPTPENSTRDDIAAELTSSLDRAGRGAMTAGLKIVDGSLGTPGLNFASDPDNGIYRTGVNTWHLVAAGAVVVTFGPGVVSIPGTVVFSMNTPLAVASGGTGAATAAAARTALDVPSNAEAVLKADSAITVPRVNTLIIDSNAAVDISLRTNNGTEQVQINHVAGSNRSLVLSGSNGGNPSIGVTGGAIALTTDTVIGGVLIVNSLVSGGVANVGMGTGSGSAVAIGTAHVNTTAVGNVGAGTDDLMSYSLPANSLSSNGKGLRVTCWGAAPVNAALKTLSFLFGGTSIFSGSLDPTANAVTWRIDVLIFRTGASTQDINFAVTESSGIFQAQRQACIQTTAAETDTSAITIKCTALGTSNNDVVQEGMLVEFIG